MAVTGVANLAELISGQSTGQNLQSPSNTAAQAQNVTVSPVIEDTFTPSNQIPPVQPRTTAIQNVQVPAAPPTAAPPAPEPTPAQTTTSAAAVAAASTQVQVQSLNTVLLTLGLNNSDIQEIDR